MAFEVKVDFGLNYTFAGGWVEWLVGGWLEKMKIEQSSASAGLKFAELGNQSIVEILQSSGQKSLS